jgi:hypothetical protein
MLFGGIGGFVTFVSALCVCLSVLDMILINKYIQTRSTPSFRTCRLAGRAKPLLPSPGYYATACESSAFPSGESLSLSASVARSISCVGLPFGMRASSVSPSPSVFLISSACLVFVDFVARTGVRVLCGLLCERRFVVFIFPRHRRSRVLAMSS